MNADLHLLPFTLPAETDDLSQLGRPQRDASQCAYENECRGCHRPAKYHEGQEL
jgi:hypothetical protein